ncbi:TetR family transcriptional regulator [Longispora fulva]|uniref:AcrR family transcriptional regulator n=1 Tax=Longispora fulva TaxID=619741 RepID=A0A8J7GUP6_9ACTN|nr:TetR/AcrR family transcriptional regulator [Longispora fulva]MBG6137731.1 AcrR family transcriptional regulator [Longispora fulva]GIG62113.1 TetR family transcriptional regulator [Longispora fulva]
MSRRTQADRTGETTTGLLDAAAALFGRDGYAATSIDEIARVAGVTKGAVYHHFEGKPGLFRAVFVRQEQLLADALAGAAADAPDAWAAVRAGCRAFLRASLDPVVRQVIVLDGPAVLGWETVRDLEREHTLAMMRRGIAAAADAGLVRPGDPETRTHLLLGALCEAALLIARSPDPAATLATVDTEVETLLDGYAT